MNSELVPSYFHGKYTYDLKLTCPPAAVDYKREFANQVFFLNINSLLKQRNVAFWGRTAQKMNFSIKDFFSKSFLEYSSEYFEKNFKCLLRVTSDLFKRYTNKVDI